MVYFEKQVREILSQYGYHFERHGKGDHDIWFNPEKNRHVAVDGIIKSRHTANAVMKQAGIDYHF